MNLPEVKGVIGLVLPFDVVLSINTNQVRSGGDIRFDLPSPLLAQAHDRCGHLRASEQARHNQCVLRWCVLRDSAITSP